MTDSRTMQPPSNDVESQPVWQSKIELYEAITSAHDTFTAQVTIPSSGTVVMADDNYSVGPCQTGWDSTSLEGGCIVLLSVMLRAWALVIASYNSILDKTFFFSFSN
jgi:hypothetical protein